MSISKDLREAIQLIKDMRPNIDPEEDYLNILAAEELISTKETKRKKELEDIHQNLKALHKTLEAARISSTRPPGVPSEEAHSSMIRQLESTQLQLGKAIGDAESELLVKEGEHTSLKEEIASLERSKPAEDHARELEGTALRMHIFQAMGFEPVSDKNQKLVKMIVSSPSGDVHSIDCTDRKNNFERTELLWKLASD